MLDQCDLSYILMCVICNVIHYSGKYVNIQENFLKSFILYFLNIWLKDDLS